MKKRMISSALLAGLLLLSGCASMLERGYTSVTSHVDYSVMEDDSILRAESYQALVNSMLYFVGEHVGGGTIRLYNYTGNVNADLEKARTEVMEQDPLGAYAVSDIRCESTRILTYYEVKLTISYRRTAYDLAAIRTASGLSGLRRELDHMADTCLPVATLQLSYFTGDEQSVSDLFWLSFYSNPAIAVDPPLLTVSFYPQLATQRILEIEAQWPLTNQQMQDYARALSLAWDNLAAQYPPLGGTYTVEELAALLHDTVVYDPSGSHAALPALLGEPANDLGVLLALEYLCGQCGIAASPVYDTAGAQMWLIVSTPSGYRHLLPQDLRPQPDPDPEVPWELPLYTDESLSALGFDWPRDLHPACVDYSGTLPD